MSASENRKELVVAEPKDTELTPVFRRLYEDNMSGKIPNDVF